MPALKKYHTMQFLINLLFIDALVHTVFVTPYHLMDKRLVSLTGWMSVGILLSPLSETTYMLEMVSYPDSSLVANSTNVNRLAALTFSFEGILTFWCDLNKFPRQYFAGATSLHPHHDLEIYKHARVFFPYSRMIMCSFRSVSRANGTMCPVSALCWYCCKH